MKLDKKKSYYELLKLKYITIDGNGLIHSSCDYNIGNKMISLF